MSAVKKIKRKYTTPSENIYRMYEQGKKEIQRTARSSEEYERRIRKLADRLGV